VAPAYDLLCTAVYATRAFAHGNAHWPHVELALALGDASTFSQVRRAHLLAAGQALGISGQTAQRELDAMTGSLPVQAMRLLAQIEAAFDGELAHSPNPEAAKLHRAGEPAAHDCSRCHRGDVGAGGGRDRLSLSFKCRPIVLR
jgi:serine/threonine-protein kinase HipA